MGGEPAEQPDREPRLGDLHNVGGATGDLHQRREYPNYVGQNLLYRELWAATLAAQIEEACDVRDVCHARHGLGCQCWQKADPVLWLRGRHFGRGFSMNQLCDGLSLSATGVRRRLFQSDRLLGTWRPTFNFNVKDLLQEAERGPSGYNTVDPDDVEATIRRPCRELTKPAELLAVCLRAWERGERLAMPGAVTTPKERRPSLVLGWPTRKLTDAPPVRASPRPPA